MIAKHYLSQILDDEGLTRGLRDPEARILIEWLVDQADLLAEAISAVDTLTHQIGRLCHKGRVISRFVGLWCHQEARSAALQLACTERFTWPLPTTQTDPCILMESILFWEEQTFSN